MMERTTTTILMDKLSTKDLETLKPGTIIAHGTIPNSPEGIYMTNSDIGRELMWVAILGFAHDWSIYIHWADKGLEYVKHSGDKVTNADNVKLLVPCSDEAFKWYRL